MSDGASSKRFGICVVRWIGWTALIIAILGLQIGLPSAAFVAAGGPGRFAPEFQFQDQPHDDSFWSKRFVFDALIADMRLLWTDPSIASATIFKNELILLLGPNDSGYSTGHKMAPAPFQVAEVIRVNLTTGRRGVSAPPSNVRHVLSDGETLWWLPQDSLTRTRPFVWQGRPVAMMEDESPDGYVRLREFVDGKWQPSELIAFLPTRFHHCNCDWSSDGSHSLFWAITKRDELWYGRGIELGVESQFESLQKKNNPHDWGQKPPFREGVWNRQQTRNGGFRGSLQSSNYVFERDGVSALEYDGGHGEPFGFDWYRYPADQNVDPEYVPLPIRWPYDNQQFRVVCSADGKAYLVHYRGSEHGWLILEWNYGQLRVISYQSDPLVWLLCLDGSLFFGLAVLIPMLVLAVVAGSLQRFQTPRLFSFGCETVVLASVIRRGIARILDLSLLMTPLMFAIVCHQDFVGWCYELTTPVRLVLSHLCDERGDLNRLSFVEVRALFADWFTALATVRFQPWLFAIALLIGVAQLIWQARSGRTVGKWLCGLKVLRTTLRPCGFARSLLRELLLVLDSLCLLSWIPGVISILTTTHSQRIGDRLADTIVIREFMPK